MGDTSFRLKLEMKNISPHTQSIFQTTGEIQNIPVVKSRIREIFFFLVVECFNQKYTRLARN